MSARILVTGGAGYIGSYVIKLLGDRNFEVFTIDNLSRGWRDAVLYGEFARIDIQNEEKVREIIKNFKPDAVMHFASYICAEESVKHPLMYYKNNLINTLVFLKAILKEGIKNFIFSSSAAVYGNAEKMPLTEDSPIKPVNPYGYTKSWVEDALFSISGELEFNFVSLRYFNACGAHPSGVLGEKHKPETHLIPLLLKTAKGARDKFFIYGTDYPTKDGTCIRDFIHIEDLASAHLLALNYLLDGGKSDVFNCGYGKGYSVLEVVETAKRITGIDIPVEVGQRREGDPPILIADSTKLKKKLGWKVKYNDLDFIIKTAWEWEKKLHR